MFNLNVPCELIYFCFELFSLWRLLSPNIGWSLVSRDRGSFWAHCMFLFSSVKCFFRKRKHSTASIFFMFKNNTNFLPSPMLTPNIFQESVTSVSWSVLGTVATGKRGSIFLSFLFPTFVFCLFLVGQDLEITPSTLSIPWRKNSSQSSKTQCVFILQTCTSVVNEIAEKLEVAFLSANFQLWSEPTRFFHCGKVTGYKLTESRNCSLTPASLDFAFWNFLSGKILLSLLVTGWFAIGSRLDLFNWSLKKWSTKPSLWCSCLASLISDSISAKVLRFFFDFQGADEGCVQIFDSLSQQELASLQHGAVGFCFNSASPLFLEVGIFTISSISCRILLGACVGLPMGSSLSQVHW